MSYDYYEENFARAKEYAMNGSYFGKDQYYALMKVTDENGRYSEKGSTGRNIFATLKKNGWRQINFISGRDTRKEEQYASEGYSFY